MAMPAAAQQAPAPAPNPPPARLCKDGVCQIRATPAEMVAATERLILAGKFDEAAPLLQALRQAPGYTLETRFLTGYMAAQQGDHAAAAREYRAILADDPNQTRVRLELAKSMMALGQSGSADRQFRLAAQDNELPPEVARTIRTVRDVIRQQRAWRLDLGFGIAPDTNINNATGAETITVVLGNNTLPFTLSDDARAKSGTGITGNLSAGLRLPVAKNMMMLYDLDAIGTDYQGVLYDDYLVQAAVGPELRLSDRASISGQFLGASRWFGGDIASQQIGGRVQAQAVIGSDQRIGFQIDARDTNARFNHAFDGWQVGLYGTYEHALSRTIVLSTGLFLRRDWLDDLAYSNVEIGANIGVGGELPMGINFAVSGGASRAVYDAPMESFGSKPRKDLRLNGRVTLGNRKLRAFGFSPEVSLNLTQYDSTYDFYSNDRARFRFALARYF